MLKFIIMSVCLIKMAEALPLDGRKLTQQSSPLNALYPGLKRLPQSQIYQPLANPYQIYTVLPSQFYPEQNTYNGINTPLLRQSILGSFINSVPFLPIQINIPDIITAIIKALQSILGPNFPLFQQGNIGTSPMATAGLVPNQDPMLPLGMMTKMGLGQPMPIPIIIVVPVKQQENEDYSDPHVHDES